MVFLTSVCVYVELEFELKIKYLQSDPEAARTRERDSPSLGLKMYNLQQVIGGSKEGAPGKRAPPGSKFFHFYAVFGNFSTK